MRLNLPTSAPLRVVVLMKVSSPWSRMVAERLSDLGIVLHIVDFRTRKDSLEKWNEGLACTSENHPLESVAEVHHVSTPSSMVARLAYSARALREIVRKNEADVVLTLYGGSLAAIAYLSGIRPYVVYVVGSDVLIATRFQKWVARLSLTAAAAVVANGESLRAKSLQVAPDAHVRPLYIGTDLDQYTFRGNEESKPRFICTRRLDALYDNKTIVLALASLRTVPHELNMCFASSGPLLRETIALADQVISPEWRARIVFLGGTSQAGMSSALASASFYLSASITDGSSTSLLEAMACGLFPIVTDIPANREWIDHEVNGLLFPPGDHAKLADNIQRAIHGEPWMPAVRTANRHLVEERANVKVNMRSLADLLGTSRLTRHRGAQHVLAGDRWSL